MIGTLAFAQASAASIIAESCGTPIPAIIRVVQIDPGPTPTFTASAPASMRAWAPSRVAIFPAATSSFGNFFLTDLTISITPFECP